MKSTSTSPVRRMLCGLLCGLPCVLLPAASAALAQDTQKPAREAANKSAANKPDGAARSVALGKYECWSFSSARMLLNFQVTGPGKYTASDGSKSSFSYNAGSGMIEFKGYLADSMPKGYTTKYHETRGLPTVSFRSARGAEVSFCEKQK